MLPVLGAISIFLEALFLFAKVFVVVDSHHLDQSVLKHPWIAS